MFEEDIRDTDTIGANKGFVVELDNMRFIQPYVRRVTVDAKKMAMHLSLTRRGPWKDHIDSLVGVNDAVIREMKRMGLEDPVVVKDPNSDIYVVKNGVNTAYAYWEKKYDSMRVVEEHALFPQSRLYRFEDLRVD